jgi:hypothetical protein
MEGKSAMSLNNDELNNIKRLFNKLKVYDGPNSIRREYLEGKNKIRDLNISIPPQLKNVKTSIGWAKKVVHAIEERLDFNGWLYNGNDDVKSFLDKLYKDNNLQSEQSMVHRDSLSYGKGFIVLGKGTVSFGEPEVLVTIEPPTKMTGEYNLRTRRLERAVSINRDEKGQAVSGALYELNQTVYFEVVGKNFVEIDRDEHNLGFVPVVEFINNRESGSTKGHSELTESIMSHINGAERTLLAMTVASEFFSAPQRYIIGTESDPFVDNDGNQITNAWEAIIGRVLALPANAETGTNPTVGQFSSNSPEPFIQQVKLYASLVSGETGIPASQLGLNSEGNPASADAIRSSESSLVKTVERKQSQYSSSWNEVAKLAILIQFGELPEDMDTLGSRWEDAATPTISARADAIVKYIQAGVLLPDSDVTLDKISILNDSEKEQVRREFAALRAQQALANLSDAARNVINNG